MRQVAVILAILLPGLPGLATESPYGLVVETVRDPAQSGLLPGDILLGWRVVDPTTGSLGPARQLESPFDLLELEVELVPRGGVELEGMRQGAPLAVPLPPRPTGAEVRPVRGGEALRLLDETVSRLQPGEPGPDEATIGRVLAATAPQVHAWVLHRGATLAARAQHWAVADTLFADALAAASDPSGRAHVLAAMAQALADQSRFDEAAVRLEEALRLRLGQAPSSLALCAVLGDVGRLAITRGDLDLAESSFRRALPIATRLAPDSSALADSLNGLGLVARNRGDLDRAETLLRGALAVYQRLLPDGVEVTRCLSNLGVVAYHRGDLAASEACFRQVLEVRERIAPDSLGVARGLENLANVLCDRGDFAVAESLYRRSLAIKERLVPDSLDTAGVLGNLASLAFDRGQLDEAEALHHQSLPILERLAPDSLDLAAALNNLGQVALERGALDEADALHRRSLAIKQQLAPDSLDTAKSLSNLATVAMARGDLDAADDLYRRALMLERSIAPQALVVARRLNNLAEVALARGQTATAEQLYRDALARYRRLAPDTGEEALVHHGLARALRSAGRKEEAIAELALAVKALEAQEGRLGGQEGARTSFRARYLCVYRDYVDLLVELGRGEEAFDVYERSRTQSLVRLLSERDLELSADLAPALETRRRLELTRADRVLAEIGSVSAESDPERLTELLRQLEGARAVLQEVRAETVKTSPRAAALRYPEPLDLAAVRRLLDPGTALLAWSVGPARSHLFVIGPGREEFACYPLAATETTLRSAVARFREAIQGGGATSMPAELLARATKLSSALLAPAASQIAAAERLVLVPDGPLHLLPFAALADPSQRGPARWLVETRPISVTTSVTLLGQITSRRRPVGAVRVAAFADPSYRHPAATEPGPSNLLSALRGEPGLAPLPSTRQEAVTLRRLYGHAAQTWLGADATEARVATLGPQYSIVHFATHALVDETWPLESSLALTSGQDTTGEEDDGLLQAWEIVERLRLDADLVTLSACSTALGQEVAGEGLVGLTSAFQYAGARSVLASLWSVADPTTARLMERFYTHLRAGARKDEALRNAQLDLLRGTPTDRKPGEVDPSHPYHWAAFELVGDGR